MKFNDIYISKEEQFSIGIEEESGKYYISIPVSSGFVSYEEYYGINKSIFDAYPANIEEVRILVTKYRNQEKDADLIIKPGENRGVAL